MKDNQEIHQALLHAETKSRSGKLKKLLRSPVLYPSLMFFNHVWYRFFKRGIYAKPKTFFGRSFRTLLPSGTDIVLNGIKSHDSEIRLSKLLVHTLKEGDVFIDVGAHYGYYSLLASSLVGDRGKVFGIEASISSFDDLKQNVATYPHIKIYHAAAGDTKGSITFYEYPGPYAEYNTIVQGAYADQKWYGTVKETINTVPILILDDLINKEKIEKAFIKIDVEGGEAAVLRGLLASLKEKNLSIAMEYLLPTEGSKLHMEAANILYDQHYKSYAISPDGIPDPVEDIDQYLRKAGLSSDNIIFKK